MARNENNNALFILGLIFGALIASAILLTSTDDKAKIIKKIKDKFNDLFGETDKLINNSRDVARYVSTIVPDVSKKISVTIPNDVETLNLTPIKTIKPKMVFKKSK